MQEPVLAGDPSILEFLVRYLRALSTAFLIVTLPLAANGADKVKVDVIKNPYGGSRNVPEISSNPDYIHAGVSNGSSLSGAANWPGRYKIFA